MFSIEKCPVPTNTLLNKYVTNGGYADCYLTKISGRISIADFLFAFYTTPLFRLERFILKLAISKPSTDFEARQLADGTRERFAAWHVEDRNENEIIMCDIHGRTRSWLMTIPVNRANVSQTQLYFGSAIAPRHNSKTGQPSLELGFRALLGFHKMYSILLLYSAKSNIKH
jgi:hypothetical protein